MPLCKLTVLTDAEGAVLIEERLAADTFDPPLAVSRFLAGGPWQVEALFAAPFEEARLAALLDGIAVEAPPTIVAVADRNWVAQVEATLKPIAAGPFLVHGPHDRAAAAGHPFAIEIEAGGAFGTAHHATTQGCLAALSHVQAKWFAGSPKNMRPSQEPEHVQAKWFAGSPKNMRPSQEPEHVQAKWAAARPHRLLDLGTGSGILAIAAAKLDPDAVILATDIDADAARIAEANAAINGVAGRIRILAADGLSHPELSSPADFDLILANILAEPLVALAPGLRRALSIGGTIILSGLLETQQAMVLAAYEREGLRLLDAWPIDGWVTLALG